MGPEEFSVVIFDVDGHWIRPHYMVSIQQAVLQFSVLTQSTTAKLGGYNRIIITDGGDSTVAEWKFGIGVVFPSETIAPAND